MCHRLGFVICCKFQDLLPVLSATMALKRGRSVKEELGKVASESEEENERDDEDDEEEPPPPATPSKRRKLAPCDICSSQAKPNGENWADTFVNDKGQTIPANGYCLNCKQFCDDSAVTLAFLSSIKKDKKSSSTGCRCE